MKAKKKYKPLGLTLTEVLREDLKDPEFRKAYEEADIEYRVAEEVIKARAAKEMTQRDLAEALGTKQQTISRIESGAQNVTIETLAKIAKALGRRLRVRFI